MRILIIGGGQTGGSLASHLCEDGHDVVVVDPDPDVLATLESHLDLMTVRGDGADPDVLERAGVARADLLVAATPRDDTNLLACIFAHQRGVPRTVARVSSPAYAASRHVDFAALGVSLLVNPASEHARDLVNAIRLPGSLETDNLLDGRVLVVGMPVHMDSPLLGKHLRDFADAPWIRHIRFFAVSRSGDVTTPTGNTSFQVGDNVYFAGEPAAVHEFIRLVWPEQTRFQTILIAGGGELGLQLAALLETSRIQVVLVESDARRADLCAADLSRATVLKGDALDPATLASVGDPASIAYVAATGSDESNIVGCLLAERAGCHFTAAHLSNPDYIAIARSQKLIDRVINSPLVMINSVLHFVRGRNVQAAAILSHLPGELLDLKLACGHPWVGKQIQSLALPGGVVLLTVLRGSQVKTPTGDLALQDADRIVLYALPDALDEIEPLFQ